MPQSTLRRAIMVVTLGLAMVLAFASPGMAAGGSADSPTPAAAGTQVLGSIGKTPVLDAGSGRSQLCAQSPKGETTCVTIARDGTVGAGLPAEVVAPPGASAQWTVGVGWYVYLYLNRSDVHWLIGLGFTGAAAMFCYMLGGTIIAAFACGVGAAIIWQVINEWAYVIPSHQCLELKFRTGLNGAKLVTRSC
nr:hypothetical protein [Micromonospora sp. DSM 115978]